jgi:hypothetical protein
MKITILLGLKIHSQRFLKIFKVQLVEVQMVSDSINSSSIVQGYTRGPHAFKLVCDIKI